MNADALRRKTYLRPQTFLIAIALAFLGFVANSKAEAQTTIPVAVIACSTCQSSTDLQNAASGWFFQWTTLTPPGYVGVVSPPVGLSCHQQTSTATVLFVISTAVPISASFYTCWTKSVSTQVVGPLKQGKGKGAVAAGGLGGGNTQSVQTVQPTGPLSTATAIAIDNAILVRAATGGNVTLPTGVGLTTSDAIEIPESYVAGVLVLTSTGSNWWHGLTSLFTGMPQVTYGVFVNTQTGQSFTIYAGDTITVTDQDGYSAQFTWNPAGPSPHWIYVNGSLRKNGQPVPNANNVPPGPTPSPGGNAQPGGALNVALPGGIVITVYPMMNNPTPGGNVTVEPNPPGAPPPTPNAQCVAAHTCASPT